MPPEQAAGDAVDARADVYAIGAILYHLLAGRPPFTGTSTDDLLVQVLTTAPLPLATRAPGVARELITIVETAMARRVEDRYATAGELAADLKRFQTGQLVGAHSYSRLALIRRWLRRHRGAVGVGAVAAVAVAVLGVVSVRNIMSERDRAEAAGAEADRQRAVAVTAKNAAVAASAQLYLDQGRQELLAGNPLRAAVLLHASLVAADTPLTRLLVGLALESLKPFVRAFESLGEHIITVGFGPDGQSAFAATWHGRGMIAETSSGNRRMMFDKGSRIDHAIQSPDGATIATLRGEDQALELWDARTGQRRGTLVPGGDLKLALQVAFSPDGTLLLAAGEALRVWNAATLAEITTVAPFASGDTIGVLDWSRDGKRLALGSTSEGRIVIVETQGWTTVLAATARASSVAAVAFSPDGTRLAYVSDELGDVLETRTGKVITALDGTDQQAANRYVGVAFSADGATLAVSTSGTNAKLIVAATGKTRQRLGGYASLVFSADGTRILSSGASIGKAAVWMSRPAGSSPSSRVTRVARPRRRSAAMGGSSSREVRTARSTSGPSVPRTRSRARRSGEGRARPRSVPTARRCSSPARTERSMSGARRAARTFERWGSRGAGRSSSRSWRSVAMVGS